MAGRKKKAPPPPDLYLPPPAWEDSTSYSQGERGKFPATSWTCQFYLSPIDRNDSGAWFRADKIDVSIIRMQVSGDEWKWCLKCPDARIYCRSLKSEKYEGAQREAVRVVAHTMLATARKVLALSAMMYPDAKEGE